MPPSATSEQGHPQCSPSRHEERDPNPILTLANPCTQIQLFVSAERHTTPTLGLHQPSKTQLPPRVRARVYARFHRSKVPERLLDRDYDSKTVLMHAAAAGGSAVFSTVIGEMGESWLDGKVGTTHPTARESAPSTPVPQFDGSLPRCSPPRKLQRCSCEVLYSRPGGLADSPQPRTCFPEAGCSCYFSARGSKRRGLRRRCRRSGNGLHRYAPPRHGTADGRRALNAPRLEMFACFDANLF